MEQTTDQKKEYQEVVIEVLTWPYVDILTISENESPLH